MQNTQTQPRKIEFSALFSSHGAMIAFIILFVFNSVFTSNFFRMQTMWNLLTQSTTTILLSLGMTVVIATAGIDISVGSAMALASMVAAKFIVNGEIFIGVMLGLMSVLFFGYITGTIVIKFNIQSMIVSLSMMFILRGIAKLLNDGRILSYRNKVFTNFFYMELFDVIPVRLVIWLSMAILLWLLMSKTRYGVYIEAYGDNPHTTRISGIGVVSVITSAYMICALFAGTAGDYRGRVFNNRRSGQYRTDKRRWTPSPPRWSAVRLSAAASLGFGERYSARLCCS